MFLFRSCQEKGLKTWCRNWHRDCCALETASKWRCVNLRLGISQQGGIKPDDGEFYTNTEHKCLQHLQNTHLQNCKLGFFESPCPRVKGKKKNWVIVLQREDRQINQTDPFPFDFDDDRSQFKEKAKTSPATLLLCHGIAAEFFYWETFAVQRHHRLS